MAAPSTSSSREMQPYRKADLRDETVNVHKKKKEKENKQNNESEIDAASKTKNKTKFVPLFGKDGEPKDVLLLPGRHPCQCQATKHALIANCLNCGRIVCSQEGSGPCFTCSNTVCTREERDILRRGDKKSEQLCKKLSIAVESVKGLKVIANELQGKSEEGLTKAIEQKNILLEYDRSCEKRTRVIDDEADYFSVGANQWLSKNEQSVLKKRFDEMQKLKQSRQKKMTFDFAGRRVIEDQEVPESFDVDDLLLQDSLSEKEPHGIENNKLSTENFNPKFQYEKSAKKKHIFSNELDSKNPRTMKIQDRQLQEMSDEGMCLSVRQPFASLLIAGLKNQEGREWYTSHRGRLWIASGNRQPTTHEIRDAESVARHCSGNEHVLFPEQYPVGSLLGCVNLIDCMSQEQYREEFPNGECEDAYVWLCEDPKELIVKFPIKGRPKLFKLDDRIHQAAQKTIKTKF